MNYVEVKGGLGNQLFQYTFSKYCERLSGKASVLQIDFFDYVKSVSEATQREFKLSKFRTDYVSVKGQLVCSRMIKESEFKGVERQADNTFYSGYWQDKRFFEDNSEEIGKSLQLKEEYITEDVAAQAVELEKNNTMAIHFRRGDYLTDNNKKIYTSLELNYYKRAIELIKENSCEDIKGYIFTDDTEYVSEIMDELGSINLKLMPMREDYEDLYLMSCAKHHIIANSSFSWWGAALSERDGLTVAPARWYLDRPSPNLYLYNWLAI